MDPKNEEQPEVQTPNYEGEEMKLPENMGVETVEPPKQSSVINAPLLFILVLLLVVILGGMYYWLNNMNQAAVPTPAPVERPTAEENNEPESTTAEAQVETAQVVSTSDEIDAIEADLEATDLESLDAEMEAIEAALDAALEEL